MQPDAGLVAARFVSLVALMAMAGVAFHLASLGRTLLARRERIAIAGLGAAGAIASLWWAAASVAAMAALPIFELDRVMLLAVLEATPLGTVLAIRLAATACLFAVLALSARTLPVLLLALAALATSAWTGHSGAAEGTYGLLQRLLDAVHLGAASLWLGALLVFIASLLGRAGLTVLIERLAAFSRTGTVVVSLLAVTGTINAVLIGRAGWSPSSGWTWLLAVKLALFLAMLGLAAVNRWRLTPALAQGAPGAQRHLAWSLGLETACALAIVALVAVLGQLDPAGV